MKHLLLSGAVVATAAGVCFVAAGDNLEPPRTNPLVLAQVDAAKKPSAKKDAVPPAKTAPDGKTPAGKTQSGKTQPSKPPAAAKPAPPAGPKLSADEEAVLQTAASLVKAFNGHDAKAFAALFTADGEYVDEKGTTCHSRQAVEEDFTGFFKSNPEAAIELSLSSTRVIAPAIVAADGTTRFTKAKGESAVAGRCSLICTKDGGQWLIASLHESEAVDEHASHHERIKPLEFLVGEWINQGGHADVHFDCRWDEGVNFLIRDFAVHIAGQRTMTGTQRIGYDPLTGHLRAWIFDSAGGYSDGYFSHDGEDWVLQTTGVTADGRIASGTQVFSPLDKHRLSWQAVDYVIGGERIPDSPKVTIVRRPPTPATTTAK